MNLGQRKICIVEDDSIMGESLRDRLELEGFHVDWLRTAGSAAKAVAATRYDLLICDDRLPDGCGANLFATLNQHIPDMPPALFITGFGSINRAVELLELGAVDYITKPFDIEELLAKIDLHCRELPPRAGSAASHSPLGVSAAMREIEETLARVSEYAMPVLLTGESGVGKEEAARRLHDKAFRGAERPFVATNCSALSESLLESELFGHERGAFTGAVRSRRGLFEQAHTGTLLLDEIADMPLIMQPNWSQLDMGRDMRMRPP